MGSCSAASSTASRSSRAIPTGTRQRATSASARNAKRIDGSRRPALSRPPLVSGERARFEAAGPAQHPETSILDDLRAPKRMPRAGGGGHGEMREAVGEAVAGALAAVPAFGGRRRLERAVASRETEDRARGPAIDPDPPPRPLLPRFDDGDGVRPSSAAERDVAGLRTGKRHLVVELDSPIGERAQPCLDPFGRPAGTEPFASDADPRGDVAARDLGRAERRNPRRDSVDAVGAHHARVGVVTEAGRASRAGRRGGRRDDRDRNRAEYKGPTQDRQANLRGAKENGPQWPSAPISSSKDQYLPIPRTSSALQSSNADAGTIFSVDAEEASGEGAFHRRSRPTGDPALGSRAAAASRGTETRAGGSRDSRQGRTAGSRSHRAGR